VAFFANDVRPRPESPEAYGVQVADEGRVRLGGLRGLLSDDLVYAVKRSRLVSALLYAQQEIRYRLFAKGDYWVDAIYQDIETPISRQAWSDVEVSLARIRDLGRERGLETIVLLLPLRAQVEGGVTTAGYQDRARAAAERSGLPVVDVLPVFREAKADAFIAFDGHPNALGHRLTADALTDPVAAALARRRGTGTGSVGGAR
jgi:hypothetical protein